jgi:hypothetical protein
MRMARAFIASVPMAIVLVAALVVPLTVIPGTFGFESWPSSHGERVTERQVRLAPAPIAVVAVRPRPAPEAKPSPASRPAPPAAAVAPRTAVAAVTPPRSSSRQPSAPPRHTSPTPRPPSPEPSAPAQPNPQPQQPSSEPEPDPGLVAGGDPPVAREDPADQPPVTPPPPAVVEVPAPAPVRHVVQAIVPCYGHHGGGEQGEDGGDEQD